MYLKTKVFLSILIILLLLSLYNDFKKERTYTNDEMRIHVEYETKMVKVKFERGDTFLSISERINGSSISTIPIEQLIADFEKLNPNVNVHSLNIGHYYNFPIYEKN